MFFLPPAIRNWRVLDPGYPSPWIGLSTGKDSAPLHYRRLTMEECRRVYGAATGEWKTLVAIAYMTGMRLGDCAMLNWSQVDLSRRIITVVPRKTARRRQSPLRIPILRELAQILAGTALPDRVGDVIPGIARKYRTDQSAVSKGCSAIFRAAKVPEATFHCFRATMQSLADDAGVARPVTRSVLGHQGAAMSDTYSKLDVEVARAAMTQAIPELRKKTMPAARKRPQADLSGANRTIRPRQARRRA